MSKKTVMIDVEVYKTNTIYDLIKFGKNKWGIAKSGYIIKEGSQKEMEQVFMNLEV